MKNEARTMTWWLLSILLMLLTAATGVAQDLSVDLAMEANPSPYISDWSEGRVSATLIVRNESSEDRFVKVRVRIFEGSSTLGTPIVASKLPEMPVLVVAPLPEVGRPRRADVVDVVAAELQGQLLEVVVVVG